MANDTYAIGMELGRSEGTELFSRRNVIADSNRAIADKDPVRLVSGKLDRANAGEVWCGIFEGAVIKNETANRAQMTDYGPYVSADIASGTATGSWKGFETMIFAMRADGDVAEADIFSYYDFTTVAGDAVAGSGVYLDASTKSTTSGQVQMIGLVEEENNDWGTNAKVWCVPNPDEFQKAV